MDFQLDPLVHWEFGSDLGHHNDIFGLQFKTGTITTSILMVDDGLCVVPCIKSYYITSSSVCHAKQK